MKNPRVLYKYCDWANPFHQERLASGMFYFACPDSLNDPYDMRIQPRYDLLSDTEFAEIARKHALRRNPRLTGWALEDTCRDMARIWRSELDHDLDQKKENDDLIINRDLGVFCLSERPDRVLMWSHYANSHDGVCLGYQVETLEWIRRLMLQKCGLVIWMGRVKYARKYPCILPVVNKSIATTRMCLTTKSSVWSYEKEWRLIIHEPKERGLCFGASVISEVVFGCNTSPSTIDAIRQQCKELMVSPCFRQAKPKRHSFELELMNLD